MFKQFVKQSPIGISAIAICTALFFLALLLPVFGRQTLIVRSGSMEPTIKTGDLVIIAPSSSFQKGDIITFKNPQNPNILVTHRITSINKKEGITTYQTKGDANKALDNFTVSPQNVIGKADYSIMQVGKLLAFSKTKNGFLTFAAIPATFVIFLEISNIFKEIKKSKKRSAKVIYRQTLKTLYQHYGKPMGVSHSSASYQSLVNTWAHWSKNTSWNIGRHINVNNKGISLRTFLPILAVLFVAGSTYAAYMDSGSSTGNVFSAAEVFPTPTPAPNIANHLVINEVMFNPLASPACGGENDAEWVEIYNPTGSSVNLDTWSVGDGNSTDDLPNVSLPGGGYAVISDCVQSSFTSIWPLPGGTLYIDLSSAIGNGLNNGGEHMRLFDGPTLIDDMSYGANIDAFSPSVTAPVAGHTIERNPDGVDTNTAADFVDRNPPTPGS